MERLTLDEAIFHAKEVAVQMNLDNCKECSENHKQLAEWLEELKSYKDIGTLKELKELKENGTFTGLELAKLAIMQKELKEYKNLEEQGLLVRLPCKVGDTVYAPTRNFISELRIIMISVDMHGTYFGWRLNSGIYPNLDGFSGNKLGKTVFLTREEAEKKLEEMKNGKK